jgi:hypothetical protein
LGAGAVLALLAALKKRYAANVEEWPTMAGKIENVFLDVSSSGRYEETHVGLGYSYSIGDEYFSGQIRLQSGESSLESAEEELIGKPVVVHYDPKKPEVSIFLEDEFQDWSVVRDRRISVWSSLGFS